MVDRSSLTEHEVSFFSDYEARYKVLICPACEIRTYEVLEYYPRFIDENQDKEGGPNDG